MHEKFSKCPHCGSSNWTCVDEEISYSENNKLVIRYFDYCEECNYQFDFVATYDINLEKSHWENIEPLGEISES